MNRYNAELFEGKKFFSVGNDGNRPSSMERTRSNRFQTCPDFHQSNINAPAVGINASAYSTKRNQLFHNCPSPSNADSVVLRQQQQLDRMSDFNMIRPPLSGSLSTQSCTNLRLMTMYQRPQNQGTNSGRTPMVSSAFQNQQRPGYYK